MFYLTTDLGHLTRIENVVSYEPKMVEVKIQKNHDTRLLLNELNNLSEENNINNLNSQINNLTQSFLEKISDSVAQKINSQTENLNLTSETTEDNLNEQNSEVSQEEIKPENDPQLINEDQPQINQSQTQESEYLLPPRISDPERLNPLTTTMIINGMPVSHLTGWESSFENQIGDNLNDDFKFNGIIKLDTQVIESATKNNIFETRQVGHYLQFQTFTQSNLVTTIKRDPQTMLGLELQMSLTGACFFRESASDEQCTFTPGLVIDRSSIDPRFFVPLRVLQPSSVGDVVSPESLAVMSLPGFQMGANGQNFGVDFYFPNLGALPGNNASVRSTMSREEVIDNSLVISPSSVQQVVKANDHQAVLGQTIFSFPFVIDDHNLALNTGLLALNGILPSFEPSLEGSSNLINPQINRYLFIAANSNRIPNNSYTIYSGGFGSAQSLTSEVKELSQIPAASFNGVWLGLSPMIDRRITQDIYYEATGIRENFVKVGGEGGANTDVQLLSLVNGENFSTKNLQDTYTQIYLSLFKRNVNYVNRTDFRETTYFVPHLSFTGNITTFDSLLRYYTGVIFDDQIQAYLGADYTYNGFNGWDYNLGAIAYVNPNRDYYSYAFGNLSKTVNLTSDLSFKLSTGLFYTFDRSNQIDEIFVSSKNNTVNFGLGINWQNINLGMSYNFEDLLPNSDSEKLTLSLNIPINDYLTISGNYTPIDQSSSRNHGGISAIFQLSKSYNSPRLVLNWSNYEYNFGNDVFGNNLSQTDNRFTFYIRFGDPTNPFDPTMAQQLRNQAQEEDDD